MSFVGIRHFTDQETVDCRFHARVALVCATRQAGIRTMKIRFAQIALWGILAVTSATSLAGGSGQDRIAFAIERQPLTQALQAFAKQTGMQVLRRDEEVPMQGVMAPKIEGTL